MSTKPFTWTFLLSGYPTLEILEKNPKVPHMKDSMSSPFRNIRPQSDAAFLELPIESARSVCVYQLLAVRNAWQDTTSSKYRSGDSLFDDIEFADAAIPALRKKGTYFKIEPRAALEVQAEEHIIVLTQINTPAPLRGWSVPRAWATHEGTPTMGDVVEAFRSAGRGRDDNGWSAGNREPHMIVGISKEPLIGQLDALQLDSTAGYFSSKGVPLNSYPQDDEGEYMANVLMLGERKLQSDDVQLAAISINTAIISKN